MSETFAGPMDMVTSHEAPHVDFEKQQIEHRLEEIKQAPEIDYNMAREAVGLFLMHEGRVHGAIDAKNNELISLVDEMEEIEQFLALLRNKTDDSQRVEFLLPHEQELVDSLRNRADLQHVFSNPYQHPYVWKGEGELKTLERLLTQHVEGPLNQKISMATQEMMLAENQLVEVLAMFRAGQNRMQELLRHINSNIQRIH